MEQNRFEREGTVVYLPLARKAALVKTLAPLCLEQVSVALGEGAEFLPMPDLWRENGVERRKWELWLLLTEYLRAELPQGEAEGGLSLETCDRFLGEGLLEELDGADGVGGRLRRDYRDLIAMLDQEIAGVLAVRNDPCGRLFAMVAMQSTPEVAQQGVEKLRQLQEGLAGMTKPKAGGKKRGG